MTLYRTMVIFTNRDGQASWDRGLVVADSAEAAKKKALEAMTPFVRENLVGVDALSVEQENALLGKPAWMARKYDGGWK
jgi:hypothetical protein